MSDRWRCAPGLAVAAWLSVAAPAGADGGGPGWIDLLSPGTVVAGLVQSGVLALRSQAELRYEALTTDIASGTIAVAGFEVRPLPWHRSGAPCAFRAQRAALAGLTLVRVDRLALRVELIGAEIDRGCIADREAGEALDMFGLDRLRADRALLTFDYELASGAAQASFQASLPGIGAAEGTARAAYLAFAEVPWSSDPEPVLRFSAAELTLEDGGALARLRAAAPGALDAPEATAAALRREVEQNLARDNAAAEKRRARARGQDPATVPPLLPMTPAQARLLESLEREVARFLGAGGQITLALAAPPGAPEPLDFPAMAEDPRLAFERLNPVLRSGPAARAEMLPAARLAAALHAPGTLGREELRQAGLALLTGRGAPRDRIRARALLAPLAAAGDAGLAFDLAVALAEEAPAEAYGLALQAAASGLPGALALLDGIEARLSLADVLAAQRSASDPSLPEAPFAGLTALRDEALARLIGGARPRDYAGAWFFAGLGAAAGDAASAAIRDEIEARMGSRGLADRLAWAAAVAPLSEALMREWIGRDLPARLAAP